MDFVVFSGHPNGESSIFPSGTSKGSTGLIRASITNFQPGSQQRPVQRSRLATKKCLLQAYQHDIVQETVKLIYIYIRISRNDRHSHKFPEKLLQVLRRQLQHSHGLQLRQWHSAPERHVESCCGSRLMQVY